MKNDASEIRDFQESEFFGENLANRISEGPIQRPLPLAPKIVFPSTPFHGSSHMNDPLPYTRPPTNDLEFAELFDGDVFSRWIVSQHNKFTGSWRKGLRKTEAIVGDYGLEMRDPAKHHAIATLLPSPLEDNLGKPLAVSYEVKFQEDVTCAGAYLKLFRTVSNDVAEQRRELLQFNDQTPYVIMFGPDACDPIKKTHLIIRQRNPVNRTWKEHHVSPSPAVFQDNFTHVYTFALYPNNTFEIKIDMETVLKASMNASFSPSFSPENMMVDRYAIKPSDWDDRETIPDPAALNANAQDCSAPITFGSNDTMPKGWLTHEPSHITDLTAVQPEMWQKEDDGPWEPPTIPNPLCKNAPGCGPWQPPPAAHTNSQCVRTAAVVPNPDYKGPWKPAMVPDPFYFESKNPHAIADINAVGFELWTMNGGILFDNVVVARSLASIDKFVEQTWKVRHTLETAQPLSTSSATRTSLPQNPPNSHWIFEVRRHVSLLGLGSSVACTVFVTLLLFHHRRRFKNAVRKTPNLPATLPNKTNRDVNVLPETPSTATQVTYHREKQKRQN